MVRLAMKVSKRGGRPTFFGHGIRRIGTGIKWLRDSMAYIPDIREIYANEKRGDWPAYLPALLPGA